MEGLIYQIKEFVLFTGRSVTRTYFRYESTKEKGL